MLGPPIRNMTINIPFPVPPLNVDGSADRAMRANIEKGHGGCGAGAKWDMAGIVHVDQGALQHYYPYTKGILRQFLKLSQLPEEHNGLKLLKLAHYSNTTLSPHSQVPICTPGFREAIMVKCLAQGT